MWLGKLIRKKASLREEPDEGKREALGPLSCDDDRGGVVDWKMENRELADVSPIIHLSAFCSICHYSGIVCRFGALLR